MPRKHSVKEYIENGYYHIYNRGVEKRKIFMNDQDFRVFLHLLKYYLSPVDKNTPHPLSSAPDISISRPRPLSNLENEVNLLTYCLMPNHFHLLIRQITLDGMTKLMSRILTTYSMYFNKRYKRVGHLFQSIYKAVLIEDESYLLHLSRYIHLNPIELTGVTPVSYPYSSYRYYLGLKKAKWVKPDFILSFFDKTKLLPFLKQYPSYKKFVEAKGEDSKEILGKLALE